MNRKKEMANILTMLGAVWARFPEQRLCQLLVNVNVAADSAGISMGDIFYVTDDDALKALAKYARTNAAADRFLTG